MCDVKSSCWMIQIALRSGAGAMTIPLLSLNEASFAGTTAAGCWAGASWDPSSTLIGSEAAHSCHWPLPAGGSMQVSDRLAVALGGCFTEYHFFLFNMKRFFQPLLDAWVGRALLCPPAALLPRIRHNFTRCLRLKRPPMLPEIAAPGSRKAHGPDSAYLYIHQARRHLSKFFPFLFILTLFQCPEITKTGH